MLKLPVDSADTLLTFLTKAMAAMASGHPPSKRQLKRLIRARAIRIGQRVARDLDERLTVGAVLTVATSALDERSPDERAMLAEKLKDVRLLGEAKEYAVVRKPAGLGSTAGFFGDQLCLSHIVAQQIGSSGLPDGGLIHRLDHGTSGVCLFAKTREAHEALVKQRALQVVSRTYWAIVDNAIPDSLLIERPIAHHPTNPERMVALDEPADLARGLSHDVSLLGSDDQAQSIEDHASDWLETQDSDAFGALSDDDLPGAVDVRASSHSRGHPQPSATQTRVLARSQAGALVEAQIRGGRRHQIRIHLASEGFPLHGDALYGGLCLPHFPTRLALHAQCLRFLEPSGEVPQMYTADAGQHFWEFAPELKGSRS